MNQNSEDVSDFCIVIWHFTFGWWWWWWWLMMSTFSPRVVLPYFLLLEFLFGQGGADILYLWKNNIILVKKFITKKIDSLKNNDAIAAKKPKLNYWVMHAITELTGCHSCSMHDVTAPKVRCIHIRVVVYIWAISNNFLYFFYIANNC